MYYSPLLFLQPTEQFGESFDHLSPELRVEAEVDDGVDADGGLDEHGGHGQHGVAQRRVGLVAGRLHERGAGVRHPDGEEGDDHDGHHGGQPPVPLLPALVARTLPLHAPGRLDQTGLRMRSVQSRSCIMIHTLTLYLTVLMIL